MIPNNFKISVILSGGLYKVTASSSGISCSAYETKLKSALCKVVDYLETEYNKKSIEVR